jgi:hypothetical protein
VDVIEFRVCKAEACAVDGIEEIKDGVMQLGRKIEEGEARRWSRKISRLRLFVSDGVRAARRRQLWALWELDSMLRHRV